MNCIKQIITFLSFGVNRYASMAIKHHALKLVDNKQNRGWCMATRCDDIKSDLKVVRL